MPLYVRNKGGNYIPAPAGLHHAVCCDVVDQGMVKGQFGEKHKVKIKWQTKATMEDGKPYLIIKSYGMTLHPMGMLRPDLESWRGRPFTDEEAAEFDLEKLLGANCQLNVVHNTKDGQTYANVISVVPAPSVLGRLQVRDYTRECQRPGYVAPVVPDDKPEPGADDGPPPSTDGDDIPF